MNAEPNEDALLRDLEALLLEQHSCHEFSLWLPEIRRMSRIGMEPEHIAARLGVPPSELAEAARAHPDVALAIIQGRAEGIEAALARNYQLMVAGNGAALDRYLKHKAGWATKSGDAPAVTIHFADQPAPSEPQTIDRIAERQTKLLDQQPVREAPAPSATHASEPCPSS